MTQTEIIKAFYNIHVDNEEQNEIWLSYRQLETEYNKIHFSYNTEFLKDEYKDKRTSFQSALMRSVKRGHIKRKLINKASKNYPNSKHFVYCLDHNEIIKDGVIITI